MEFEKGKLYTVLMDKHYEGCVFEYVGKDPSGLKFNVIKGNENFKWDWFIFDEWESHTKIYFEPLIPTKDDVNECEPCPENGYDEINKSFHYNQGIEAIEYIESHNMNFNEGNVIKYVTRAKYKGTYIKDLEKARYYLDRLIQKGENND